MRVSLIPSALVGGGARNLTAMSAKAEGGIAVAAATTLDEPLTAAGDYLAGATSRFRVLAAAPNALAEAHEHLLEGIHSTIEQTMRATVIAKALAAEGGSDAAP
jgi:hypothetical protein